MKKKKRKKRWRAQSAPINPVELAPPVSGDVLEPFLKEVSSRVIPTSEIAKLAAILAHGRDITNPQSLAFISTQSIALWEECDKARNKRIEMLAIYARSRAIKAARDKLPRPQNFPASLEEVLKILMPKKRPEDRMKCYREYLFDTIERRNVVTGIKSEIPADQEVAKWIAENKKDGFIYAAYDYLAEEFHKWLPKYEAKNRRIKAKAGAEALKKKRQKNG